MRLGTCCWLIAALDAAPPGESRADEKPLSRIAFGLCANHRLQPAWDAVVAAHPDLSLFLGDNIYADTEDMDVLRRTYQRLGEQPGFQKLNETCPILATWDDHDFGANDAGGEDPKKRESQQVFLDFFGVSKNDPRRGAGGRLRDRFFGPFGKRVQIMLLDTRCFRSPLKKGSAFKAGRRNSQENFHELPESQWSLC
jgi:alkaline phosphatase D